MLAGAPSPEWARWLFALKYFFDSTHMSKKDEISIYNTPTKPGQYPISTLVVPHQQCEKMFLSGTQLAKMIFSVRILYPFQAKLSKLSNFWRFVPFFGQNGQKFRVLSVPPVNFFAQIRDYVSVSFLQFTQKVKLLELNKDVIQA